MPRGSQRRCSVRKGVLRNFAKFTRKHLCQSLFFDKFAGQENLTQVFSCEFCEIFKDTCCTEEPRATASMCPLDKKVKTNQSTMTQKFYVNYILQPICFQCTLFLPQENIRKPCSFLMLSGGRERVL